MKKIKDKAKMRIPHHIARTPFRVNSWLYMLLQFKERGKKLNKTSLSPGVYLKKWKKRIMNRLQENKKEKTMEVKTKLRS